MEWAFLGYSYRFGIFQILCAKMIFFRVADMRELQKRNEFSTLEITLVLRRNESYYNLTWFISIMILTILTPVGLLLPSKLPTIFPSGEIS